MTPRTRLPALLALAGCAVLAALSFGSSASAQSEVTPTKGGDLIIARTADSSTMDATSAFDNEAIWVFEQAMETLYTVTPDGKDVKPWLATSYDLSPNKLAYTFHLRKGVKFHDGKEMTADDVKFSLDAARNTKGGWEFIDAAIKNVTVKDKYTVVVHTKYKWAPMVADIALFSNAIIPKNYGGKSKKDFYNAPVGTGPFKWDHWTRGKEVKFVKFDQYWQKGKPYLDSVTWTNVPDENTRLLQLKGGQAHIDEFPGWAQVKQLQNTAGIKMNLFPSTRTDYLLFNEKFKPLQDVHVRRALSYLIDRKALVQAILFGNGKPANSFMPPQVPYYDPKSPGLQYDVAKAKAELAKSSVPKGFTTTFESIAGQQDSQTIAQVIQAAAKPLGITINIIKKDANAVQADWSAAKYPGLNNSYWTMDIADPDELVSFSLDPAQGAHSHQTYYNNPKVAAMTRNAAKEFDPKKRQALYSQIQKIASEDAFMAFLYYSPFRYANTDKVHGFQVYPTGNYHIEDVWLSK
ncbi:MAG: peptide/nickel transport system substrate-binding protein [Gaiellales bacterium]|nr:peptide/nickel transport system substrate-binding protein [Gaiellales bacterium]